MTRSPERAGAARSPERAGAAQSPERAGTARRTLVLGGIRSGKSEWAEEMMSRAPRVRYVATGSAGDSQPAWVQRVDEHRRRRPPEWSTVETTDVAAELRNDPARATLVDDLGGWLTAALDRRGWDGVSPAGDVDDLLRAIESFTAPLTVVSPEVGLTVVPATAAGRLFADELGRINQRIARLCDQVVLVIAGQPLWVKAEWVKSPSTEATSAESLR